MIKKVAKLELSLVKFKCKQKTQNDKEFFKSKYLQKVCDFVQNCVKVKGCSKLVRLFYEVGKLLLGKSHIGKILLGKSHIGKSHVR